MQLRFAIAEDTPLDAERLEDALRSGCPEGFDVQIDRFESGDRLLSVLSGRCFDMVFLDICMNGTDGIETARRIRLSSENALIVFVTSLSDYVWDALPIHPFDFLVKPCDPKRVAKMVEDGLRALHRTEPELEVRIARRTVLLPYGHIAYATVRDHQVCAMSKDGEYRVNGSFAELENRLCQDPRFLSCNRGVVINMSEVLRFEDDHIQMLDGTCFPLRQRDKGELFAAFTQYQFRHMRRDM